MFCEIFFPHETNNKSKKIVFIFMLIFTTENAEKFRPVGLHNLSQKE